MLIARQDIKTTTHFQSRPNIRFRVVGEQYHSAQAKEPDGLNVIDVIIKGVSDDGKRVERVYSKYRS
jgi:hypothetical protein